MTVLQKIIEVFTESKKDHEVNGVLFPTESKLFGDIIAHLQTQLSAEEQQIRDAYEAGDKWGNTEAVIDELENRSTANPYPDLETYINNLNK